MFLTFFIKVIPNYSRNCVFYTQQSHISPYILPYIQTFLRDSENLGPPYVLSERQMALQRAGRLLARARDGSATIRRRRRARASSEALAELWNFTSVTDLPPIWLSWCWKMAMSFEIILWSYLPVCHFFSFYQVYYWEKTKKSIFSSHQTLATSLMFCY